MANAPYFFLRRDEEVLLAQRPSWGHAVDILLTLLVLAAVPLVAAWVVLGFTAPAQRAWIPLAGAVAAVLAALIAWRRWATSEYVVTDHRLYARHGRLVTTVHFTTHDRVTDLHLRQGPLQRALGVASLVFSTAGGDVRMAGVRDALRLKEVAEGARDAFIQRLLERAGVDARAAPQAAASAPAASAAPAAPLPQWTGERPAYVKAGDAPAWSARPVLASALAQAGSLVGLVPVALYFAFLRGAVLPAVVLLVGGALVLAVRVLQLRRTRYLATDKRVYARSGVVGTTVNQLTYDKITDIAYQQDLLGRLLGYGSVTLSTAGGGNAPIQLRGLRDPLAAKETIEALRDAYLREGR